MRVVNDANIIAAEVQNLPYPRLSRIRDRITTLKTDGQADVTLMFTISAAYT